MLYALRAFLFYCSLTRQAFFFHIAIRLAYQLFFPLLIHSKEAFLSQKKTPTKVVRKTISSDFLPRDSLAFSVLQLLFLEVYIMSTELQEHFSREVIVCLDYFTVLSSNSRQRHLAQWSGTKWEWVCCLRFFLCLGLKQWKNQTGNSSFC